MQALAPLETNGSSFELKRIELLIESSNKKVMSELKQLREELHQLKSQSPTNAKHEQIQTQHHVQQEVPNSRRDQQQVPAQTPAPVGQTRFGKYTSDDVSVEKFFSFSKK
jgi:hypothetical protein